MKRALTMHEQVHLHATGGTKCPPWTQYVKIDEMGHFVRNSRGHVIIYDSE